jgi:hypothetical protein
LEFCSEAQQVVCHKSLVTGREKLVVYFLCGQPFFGPLPVTAYSPNNEDHTRSAAPPSRKYFCVSGTPISYTTVCPLLSFVYAAVINSNI